MFHHYHTILVHYMYIWSSWQSMDKKNYTCSCFFHVIWFSYPKLCDEVCQWPITSRWFLWVIRFPPPIILTATIYIFVTKILLKVVLSTINEQNGRTLIFLIWTVSVFVYPSSPDHECSYQMTMSLTYT